MNTPLRWFTAALVIGYPLVVYFGLKTLPLSVVAGAIVILALLRLATLRNAAATPLVQIALSLLLALLAIYTVIAQQDQGLRYYPALVNLVMLAVFGWSLLQGMPLIERIARAKDPQLPPQAIAYTRKVTWAWCLFFIINGAIALYTAVAASLDCWTLYNGLIAYLLMGGMFAGEWLLRQRVLRKSHAAAD